MELLLAALWAAMACTMLQPEAGVMADLKAEENRAPKSLNITCPPKGKSGHVAGRINGGALTTRGRLTFMAFIQNYQSEIPCVGALIHPQWVLTNAECIYGTKTIQVWIGNTNFSNCAETGATGVQRFIPDRVTTPPSYPQIIRGNNIGLLHLTTPAILGVNVRMIPLATRAETEALVKNTVVHGVIFGWGYNNATVPGDYLKFAFIRMIDRENCTKVHGEARNDTSLCFWGIDGFPCEGDQGSPVEYKDKVIGVLENHSKHCKFRHPLMVTDVGRHLDWIKKTLNSTGDQLPVSSTQQTTQLPAG